MSRNLDAELDELLADCGMQVAIGLRAQGHLPTVRKMLEDGENWEAIGAAIHWDPKTAEEWYEREDLAEKVREACAQKVEAAGCSHLPRCGNRLAPESHPMGYGALIEIHDERCPKALAEALRRMA